jgi:siroheme synthase-like protein
VNTAHLLALELDGLPVIVFGQTEEASRRAIDLARTGALVTLVSPEQNPLLQSLEKFPGICVRIGMPSPTDLDGQWLAVVADRNREWVELLGPAARQKRVFFCAVDQPGQNTFSHVGVARAGHLAVGISTQGRAPGISAVLTREFQELFVRSGLERIVTDAAQLREETPVEQRGTRMREFVRQIRIEGRIVRTTPEPPLDDLTTRKGEL